MLEHLNLLFTEYAPYFVFHVVCQLQVETDHSEHLLKALVLRLAFTLIENTVARRLCLVHAAHTLLDASEVALLVISLNRLVSLMLSSFRVNFSWEALWVSLISSSILRLLFRGPLFISGIVVTFPEIFWNFLGAANQRSVNINGL